MGSGVPSLLPRLRLGALLSPARAGLRLGLCLDAGLLNGVGRGYALALRSTPSGCGTRPKDLLTRRRMGTAAHLRNRDEIGRSTYSKG
jgi:hypothetical protein